MDININAIIELAKSFGRFIYFGLLGLISTFLVSLAVDPSLASSYVTIGDMKLPVGVLIVAGVTGVAKIVDRYRHVNPEIDSNGIAPNFLQR